MACAATGNASVLYDNTANDTTFTDSFILNGLVEGGDQILLTTPGQFGTSAATALFNASSSAGAALSVTLRLYALSGSDLGAQITSSTLMNVAFPANTSVGLTFSGLNVALPQELVWTLSYTATDPIALEFLDYDPPIFGSSDNTTIWWDTGSGLQRATPGFTTQNYYFQLSGSETPVPEPSGFSPLAACLLLGAAWIWRKRRPC